MAILGVKCSQLAALAAAAALTACSAATETRLLPLDGRVVQVGTSSGVSGATVRVDGKSATTDATGDFSFDQVREGSHELTVEAPGHSSYSASVSVTPGRPPLTVQLTPISGSVSGVVRNSLAQPVVGATVQIAGNSTTTDALGRYAFPTIPQANHTLTVNAPGYRAFSASVLLFQAVLAFDVALAAADPEAPTDISGVVEPLQSDLGTRVRLSWQQAGASIVAGYRVLRSRNSASTASLVAQSTSVSGTDRVFVDLPLESGAYRYCIQSRNIDGVYSANACTGPIAVVGGTTVDFESATQVATFLTDLLTSELSLASGQGIGGGTALASGDEDRYSNLLFDLPDSSDVEIRLSARRQASTLDRIVGFELTGSTMIVGGGPLGGFCAMSLPATAPDCSNAVFRTVFADGNTFDWRNIALPRDRISTAAWTRLAIRYEQRNRRVRYFVDGVEVVNVEIALPDGIRVARVQNPLIRLAGVYVDNLSVGYFAWGDDRP